MSEIADAFRRIEHPNVRTNTSVQSFHCALCSFAQACLQRMEQQLYRIEVRRIRRQVAEASTNSLDQLLRRGSAASASPMGKYSLHWAWVRKCRFHESAASTGSQN